MLWSSWGSSADRCLCDEKKDLDYDRPDVCRGFSGMLRGFTYYGSNYGARRPCDCGEQRNAGERQPIRSRSGREPPRRHPVCACAASGGGGLEAGGSRVRGLEAADRRGLDAAGGTAAALPPAPPCAGHGPALPERGGGRRGEGISGICGAQRRKGGSLPAGAFGGVFRRGDRRAAVGPGAQRRYHHERREDQPSGAGAAPEAGAGRRDTGTDHSGKSRYQQSRCVGIFWR